MRKIGGFGVVIENRRLNRAQNFVVAHMHMIGVMVMKSAKRGNGAGDDVKSTRYKIAFCAIGAHSMNKFDGA